MPTSATAGGSALPSPPGDLEIVSVTKTSIHLAWKASRSGARATGYRIYVGSALRATVRGTSYRVGQLRCGRSYVLAVGAYDAAGHRSRVRSRTVRTSGCAPSLKAPKPSPCTAAPNPGADLPAVVAGAAPGAVICLNGGDYGRVAIRNIRKTKAVIIRAAAGAAVSLDLEVVASSGLRFTGLTVRGLLLGSASNISFTRNAFTGISVVQTQIPHANIVFAMNRLDGVNAGPDDYEGRLTIRGYKSAEPAGVTISDNHFGGGCSDGVQVVGDANGVRIGPGNEFTGIRQSGCDPVHADPIQLNGAIGTVVTGNFFHDNGDGTGGLASFAGDGPATVTDNVFVCSCVYPLSIAAYGARGWLVSHNTFVGGDVRFQGTDSGMQPGANVVRDNVWIGGGLSTSTGGWGTNDHNLNSGEPGAGNVEGTPIFVGGRKPRSYQGYRLAPRSRGTGAASDGGDMGIRARG